PSTPNPPVAPIFAVTKVSCHPDWSAAEGAPGSIFYLGLGFALSGAPGSIFYLGLGFALSGAPGSIFYLGLGFALSGLVIPTEATAHLPLRSGGICFSLLLGVLCVLPSVNSVLPCLFFP